MRYYFTAFLVPTPRGIRRRIDGPCFLPLATFLRAWKEVA